MFFEEIRTKEDISYTSICSFSILYNSKFVLMAMYLGTKAVVETRVHCRYFAIFAKEDNVYDFLFAFLYAKSLLKRCLLYEERKLPSRSNIFSYRVDPISEGYRNNFDTVVCPDAVSVPL